MVTCYAPVSIHRGYRLRATWTPHFAWLHLLLAWLPVPHQLPGESLDHSAHPEVLTRASAPGTQVSLASWTSWRALQQRVAGCLLHVCVLDGDISIVLCGSG